MGRRIMHTAQNRELPREVFGRVADVFEEFYPGELARSPRFANGQEEIKLVNGGRYRIVAPTRGGARGPSNDDVIVDEVRELDSHDFIAAAKPTMNASPNPQILYLSNMGDDSSEVLNADPAAGRRGPGARVPRVERRTRARRRRRQGLARGEPVRRPPAADPRQPAARVPSHRLAGTLAIFETEHLCRRSRRCATSSSR
jgi:hypothetical protein